MENGQHCHCPEPGCMFAGSPPALRDHLAMHHAWLVTPITYGKVFVLELQAAERHRLLATEDGAHVFLLVASERVGGARAVKVVCVRAGAGEGSPWRYKYKVWTRTRREAGYSLDLLLATMSSCAVPSEEAAMGVGGETLHVPPHMATAAGGLVLRVRIDKR